MSAQRIRPLALCIFHHQGKILLHQFDDPVTQSTVFRPIGGGIEFGETSHDAIVREVQEELGQTISNVRLLGTLENIFTYAGKPGHEIVQLYDARFNDTQLYAQPWLEGSESDGAPFRVQWWPLSSFTRESSLVPKGLYDLLQTVKLD